MASSAPFRRVIIAFDGSKDSFEAVRLVCSIASKYGSAVTLVHVFNPPGMTLGAAAGVPIPDYGSLEDAAKAAGQGVISKGLDLAAEMGLKANGELIEAPSVVEAIVNYAEGQGADLIVVGTRGMTGLKQLI